MTRWPIALVLTAILTSGVWAAEEGLVAHWDFGEGKGDILHDRSGNNNHGKIHGAKWVKGRSGNALEFDGKDDYVDCGNAPILNITGPITVEVWSKAGGARGTLGGNLVSKYSDYCGYSLRANPDGTPLFYVTAPKATPLASAPPYRAGQWVHLVGTWDGKGTIQLYVNGARGTSTRATKLASTRANLHIGRASHHDGEYFAGVIDEVRIYNRALPAEEIRQRFWAAGGENPSSRPADADKRLILHYAFDKGSGQVVHDKSGYGNSGKIVGKAEWVKDKSCTALSFNGTDTYVDCGLRPAGYLLKEGTLETWCLATKRQGGLICWDTGTRGVDSRLVVGFLTWCASDLVAYIADGKETIGTLHPFDENIWTHVVMTFDGEHVRLYRNGEVLWSTPQTVSPAIKGVPLWIGYGRGVGGLRHFNGLIGEVRIYDRALSAKEVAQHLARGAKSLALKEVVQPRLALPRLHAKRGEIVVEADLTKTELVPVSDADKTRTLPDGAVLKMEMRDAENNVLQEAERRIPQEAKTANAVFKTHQLQAGPYEISAVVTAPGGTQVSGRSKAVKGYFPRTAQRLGEPPRKKILNNLVTELVNVDSLPAEPYTEISFTNPRDGWVFVSSTAAGVGYDNNGINESIAIAIDGAEGDAVIKHLYGQVTTREAMRHLGAGEHKLRVWRRAAPRSGGKSAVIRKLIVRSVPALMYCAVPAVARAGYGPYGFEFLEKDVLPNINIIIGGYGAGKLREWHEQWQRRGGWWLLEKNIPTLARLPNVTKPLTSDFIYQYWTQSTGFTNPYMDGVMCDEFYGGNMGYYDAYTEAIKRVAANELFKNKVIYCWCTELHGAERSRNFAKAVISCGYKLGWEVYRSEKATTEAAREGLYGDLRKRMLGWQKNMPGFTKDMIVVLGILCAPPESLNVNPHVDYKVWMDMQCNYLANAPECFGIYGMMVYKSHYADEESIRWAGRLFRHYGIEGNTDLLSERYGYKYRLDHITNGDFDDELAGWTVSEAAPGSVKAGSIADLGPVLGRYGAPKSGPGSGNWYLWMKRSAEKANTVSQEIKNLVPGNLYSMKMNVADYQDVAQEKDQKKRLGVSVKLDNVDVDASKSFVSDVKCRRWINHHRIVFRAKGPTARLTLSDWPDAKTPGGPAGQELLVNFIEIQPYFRD